MILYILRHAVAVEPGRPAYEDDSQRPLSGKGIAKMEQIAAGLRRMDVEFDLIFTSPYLRARQTAEILAKPYSLQDKLIVTPALLPEAPAGQIVAEINESYDRLESLILVGHEPFLSNLTSMLISGDPTLDIVLKKGGLCRLYIDQLLYDRCATLEWLLLPSQIANLARVD